jgi:hypothetical protein
MAAGCQLVGLNESPDQQSAVFLVLESDEFVVGDTIRVTVENNSDSVVSGYDQQSFCTILKLELLKDNSWSTVGNCLSGVPSESVSIPIDSSVVVSLGPGQPPFGPLDPGTYRTAFSYSPGGEFTFEPDQSFVAYSDTLTIR